MKAWSADDLEVLRLAAGRPYAEFLREPSMSAGLYTLPVGGTDGQSPHGEDEIYIVMAGRSRFTAGDQTRDAAPGDLIFVAAGVSHRFHDIVEELRVLVVFAPPEHSQSD
jgi:mannose-6-phosphate isomerase-like protein (cupin superfamily)